MISLWGEGSLFCFSTISWNLRSSTRIEKIHPGIIMSIKRKIKGEVAMGVEKNIKRICKINELPDLPKREPIPSIADLPLSFVSGSRGMKAISFVLSKTVYLEERLKTFCRDPKKTQRRRGEEPKRE